MTSLPALPRAANAAGIVVFIPSRRGCVFVLCVTLAAGQGGGFGARLGRPDEAAQEGQPQSAGDRNKPNGGQESGRAAAAVVTAEEG